MNSKTPSTNQLPWSPIEVFQINIAPKTVSVPSGSYARTARTKLSLPIASRVRNYARAYAESLKRSISYYNQIKNCPNVFTVAIGVWREIHIGTDLETEDGDIYKGSDVDYQWLFEFLYNGVPGKNFDPLRVIRENRSKIEGEIERGIQNAFDNTEEGGTINRAILKSVLERIAQKHLDEVRNYITGGDKPNLSDKTTEYFRPMKHIDSSEPLVATGQLLDAVRYEVYVDQTQDFRRHAEVLAKQLEEAQRVERNRKTYAREKLKAESLARLSRESPITIKSDIVSLANRASAVEKVMRRVMSKGATTKENREQSLVRNRNVIQMFVNIREEMDLIAKQQTERYGSNTDNWDRAEKSRYRQLKDSLVAGMNKVKEARAAIEFLENHGGEAK